MTIPCLKDNYAYLVVCQATGQAAVVDPSEAAPVYQVIEQAGVDLTAIWNTHHHWDHTGGNTDLLQTYPHLAVYGHAYDRGRIDGQTHFLEAGDILSLGELNITVIANPGHTLGAISYYIPEAASVFTGDTLFAAGCGRVFEGTMSQMYASLNHQLGQLPGHTAIYFGHEYTYKNLLFAQAAEPQNTAIQQRLNQCQGQQTTPSRLDWEHQTNPFLRCDSPAIRQKLNLNETAASHDVFAALRQWKDHF